MTEEIVEKFGDVHTEGWDAAWKIIDAANQKYGQGSKEAGEVVVATGAALLAIVASSYDEEQHTLEQLSMYDQVIGRMTFLLRNQSDEEGEDTDSTSEDANGS